MTYRELIYTVNVSELGPASDICDMLNCGGIYIEDYSDLMENPTVIQVGIVDEALLQKDKTKALIHVYVDENTSVEDCRSYIEERFSSEGIIFTFEEKSIAEEDYANSWKQYYKPLKIGKSLVIVPEWEEYEASEGETVLTMNPGMAFGTGSHETTSMCAEALQQIISDGDNLLDVGCGSGILAVTALLFGAAHADASDIDENAVKITRENAFANGVGEKITAYCDNLLESDSNIRRELANVKYDVIVANIVADIIVKLTDFIGDYLKPDGYFIMSGIIVERYDDVAAALNRNGFTVTEVREKRGWNCIIAVKNQGA